MRKILILPPDPLTTDPYLLSTINQLPAFLIDFKKKVSTYHKTGQPPLVR